MRLVMFEYASGVARFINADQIVEVLYTVDEKGHPQAKVWTGGPDPSICLGGEGATMLLDWLRRNSEDAT